VTAAFSVVHGNTGTEKVWTLVRWISQWRVKRRTVQINGGRAYLDKGRIAVRGSLPRRGGKRNQSSRQEHQEYSRTFDALLIAALGVTGLSSNAALPFQLLYFRLSGTFRLGTLKELVNSQISRPPKKASEPNSIHSIYNLIAN
jgi:hypothetical protein